MKKILLATPHKNISQAISSYLKNTEYKIIHISTSTENCILKATELKPDLIIIALMMEKKGDGINTVEIISSFTKTPHIYLIKKDSSDLIKDSSITNPDGYLAYPLEKDQLLLTLEVAFNKSHAELALKESEDRFKDIVEIAPDYITIMDNNLDLTYVSPGFSRSLGYENHELIGKSFHNFIHPEDLPTVIKELSKTKAKTIYRCKTKSSEWLWFQTTTKKFQTKIKKENRIITITQNITRSLAAEEELRDSEDLFRTLVENQGEGVTRVDINDTFLFANRAAEEIFGLERGKLIGRNISEFIHQEYLGIIKEQNQLRVSGIRSQYEIVLNRPDGEIRFIEITGSPEFDKNGVFKGTFGIIQDVTEKKVALELIKKSESKYRTIFETTGTATLIVDKEGIVLLANSEFEKLVGFEKNEIENKLYWINLLTPLYKKKYKEFLKLKNIYPKTEQPKFEFKFITKNKEIKTAIFNIKAIPETEKTVVAITDISERITSEKALQDSERRFKTVFDYVIDTIYIKDKKLRYTFANPAMSKLIGKSLNDIIGFTDEELLNKSLSSYLKKLDRKVMLGETVEDEYNATINDKDLFLNTIKVPIIEGNDKVIGMCGVVRDLTRRNKAESLLRKSEERYRNLIENANDIIFTMDFEGNFTSINPIAEKMFGYKISDLLNSNIKNFLTENSNIISQTNIRRKLINKQPHTRYEVEGIRSDGQIITLDLNNYLGYKDGLPFEIFGIARDVTEKKKAEFELKEREERIRTLVENQGEGVCIVDTNETFTFANRSAELLFGVSPGTLVGKSISEYTTPEEFSKIRQQTHNRLKGSSSSYEFDIVRPDGEIRNVHVNVTPQYGPHGEFYGGLGVLLNITERKRAEAAIHRTKENLFTIFNSVNDAIFLLETDGSIIDVNEKMLELYTVSRNNAINYSFFTNYSGLPEKHSSFESKWNQVILGKNQLFEWIANRPEHNSTFPIELFLRKINYENRDVILATIRDITERKLMENAKYESEELYRKLVTQLPDLIFIHKNNEILFTNDIATAFLGHKHSELRGMSINTIVKEPDICNIIGTKFETEIITKSHETKIVTLRSEKISYNQQEALLTVFTDITEQKRMEINILKKVIETEERERKRFAEDLHDSLGPLLSSIKIYVNLIQSKSIQGDERENLVKYTNELIDDAVSNARKIANNLMPTILNDYGLVISIKAFCNKLNYTKKINIDFHSFDANLRFDTDIEVVFYRVIMELINNTIKHAQAENINIQLTISNDVLGLDYHDDGKGFEFQGRFDRDASGMGLNNILSRVKSINGRYDLDSAPDKGMTAKIRVKLKNYSNLSKKSKK